MSRYRISALLALGWCGLVIALGKPALCWFALAALTLLIGLGVAFPQLSFFGRFICAGNRTRRQVALTFDDGPDARSTPALLDLLRAEKIPATFFCIGQRVARESELTARIQREGHLLANHTFTHSNLTNCFGPGRLRQELLRTQEAICSAANYTPKHFRPPIGLSNPFTFYIAGKIGLQVIGWSIRSLDTRIADSARVVTRVVARLQPGSIILLHDGNIPAERLVLTVRLLLAKLREHGYEVVRLDELLA